MLFIVIFALLGMLLFGFCRRRSVAVQASGAGSLRPFPFSGLPLWLLLFMALCLRLLLAALSRGFGSDTACFAAWADRIFTLGPGAFYSPDVFTDYPPGYMYVLWLIGGIRRLFGLEYYSVPHLLLLRLPAILCDLACGLLLYREACQRGCGRQGFFLSMAYLFNPAILLNSSLWGQVDSLFTLVVAYMCLCLVKGRLPSAYIAFCTGLLIKPQMLLFAPVLLAGILDWVFLKDFSVRKLFHHLFLGTTVILGTMIVCMPFGLEKVWEQYFSTLSSYPYAAVNACNLWGLLGLNWVSQDSLLLGIPCRTYGAFAIAGAVALMLFFSLRSRSREKYPFLGALLVLTVFAFSVRMHERYLYPGLLLLLLAYVYRPEKLTYFCYGGFSVMHFLNTAHVLFFYDPANYDRKAPFLLAVSGGMLVCTALLLYTAFRLLRPVSSAGAGGQHTIARRTESFSGKADSAAHSGFDTGIAARTAPDPDRRPFHSKRRSGISLPPRPSSRPARLNPADYLLMLTITLVYSCFALYDLGDRQAPSTPYEMTRGQAVELSFEGNVPSTLWYYIAPWHNRAFTLESRASFQEAWNSMGEITLKNVFTWQQVSLEGAGSQLRLTLKDSQASILEWVFLDEEGNVLTPMASDFYGNLFDEGSLFPRRDPDSLPLPEPSPVREALTSLLSAQNGLLSRLGLSPIDCGVFAVQVYPEAGSFRNSMYFDEIYHGRTAYEFLHGLTSYENTHPPMGKIFIALGVALFGMNPFGWRIIGTLFGIAMVPVMYLFAKRLLRSTPLAALACLLFAFDFMHFSQTRIATIDVYITFFVILMYYFMYRYCSFSFYDTPLKKTWLPLGACGLCMGLGIACKWTGIYGGAGLALIFFSTLLRRYREYLYAKKDPEGTTHGISHRHILQSFGPKAGRTICFCMVFFVLLPALIYLLSYIPFRDYTDKGLFGRMLQNQNTMFSYHSNLESTHDFSSVWYEWPILKRPIWFYSHMVTRTWEGGLREGISSFGNPAVWWAGIPAALFTAYLWAKKKDKTAAFLTVGYLAQYLPWFFVSRITFIYHYFPSVPFVVLMITYCLRQGEKYMVGPAHGLPQGKNAIDSSAHDLPQGKKRMDGSTHGLPQGKKRMDGALKSRPALRTQRSAFYASIVLYGAVAFGLFLLFYPVLSGQPVEASFVAKYLRWFKSWVLTAK